MLIRLRATIAVDTVAGTALIEAGYAELVSGPIFESTQEVASRSSPETATLIRSRQGSRKA
jgi:hypothetical protein